MSFNAICFSFVSMALILAPSLSSRARGEQLEDKSRVVVVQAVPPKYPSIARSAQVSGEVTAEATIDSQGVVSAVRIVNGHKLLNLAVERAASKWKFNPLVRRRATRKILLRFQFTLIPSNKGTPDDLGVVFWPPYKVEIRDSPHRVD